MKDPFLCAKYRTEKSIVIPQKGDLLFLLILFDTGSKIRNVHEQLRKTLSF